MIENAILSAKDFIFAPFAPDVGGDSGALLLATLNGDPGIKYVVKGGYSEVACNEFMYHHVAAALGLYTQETKLIKGIPGKKYAVGIRYVPNARKFILDEASEDNRRTYFKFWTLYRILNENDSEEYFYDEQDRVFKLDNAASFNLDTNVVDGALKYKSKEPPAIVWHMLISGLDHIEYENYAIIINILNKYNGRAAAETAFEFIGQFSEFDLSGVSKLSCNW